MTATLDVSQVIQRLPHISALKAVVPEPQVGSNTRSPGWVVMSMHRATTRSPVCTLYSFAPTLVSVQCALRLRKGKSEWNRLNLICFF